MRNKNIIFLGYYDDYARFYSAIADELKPKGFSSLFFYQNLSGFLFSSFHLNRACWLSFSSIVFYAFSCFIRLEFGAVFFPKVKMHDRKLLRYSFLSNRKLTRRQKTKLIFQINSYRKYIKYIFDSHEISAILLPGDARMSELIFKFECEKRGISVLYFEQGPYGTTIIDTEGVNANASFRFFSGGKGEFSKSEYYLNQQANNRTPFYRAIDIIFERILFWSYFFPEDCIEKKMINKNKAVKADDIKKPYVLFVLQVPNDANYTHHTPLFRNYHEMLMSVYEAIPEDFYLVVREHPLFIGRYDDEIYRFIDGNDRLILCSGQELSDSILESELVVVNNSTTGMDALKLGKKVLVLGDSYYDQLSIVRKVLKIEDIGNCIKEAVYCQEENSDFDRVIDEFVTSNFLPGHFRDQDLSNLSQKVASIIESVSYD